MVMNAAVRRAVLEIQIEDASVKIRFAQILVVHINVVCMLLVKWFPKIPSNVTVHRNIHLVTQWLNVSGSLFFISYIYFICIVFFYLELNTEFSVPRPTIRE